MRVPAWGKKKHEAAVHLRREDTLDKGNLIGSVQYAYHVAADKTLLLFFPLHSTKDNIRATKSKSYLTISFSPGLCPSVFCKGLPCERVALQSSLLKGLQGGLIVGSQEGGRDV